MATTQERVTRTQLSEKPWIRRARRIAINAFLIFHLFGITCWSIPLTNPLLTSCRNLVRPYFLWSGLFQSWDMFSPTPRAINSYVEAIVLYKDGTTRNWAFPRMNQLGLNERYFKERYRKYVENLAEDSNAALWPDAARRIARLNNIGSSAPSGEAMIFLVRYAAPIIPQSGPDLPVAWDSHVFYVYPVDAQDLQ